MTANQIEVRNQIEGNPKMKHRIQRDPRRALSYYGFKGAVTRLTIVAHFGYDARTPREIEETRSTEKQSPNTDKQSK